MTDGLAGLLRAIESQRQRSSIGGAISKCLEDLELTDWQSDFVQKRQNEVREWISTSSRIDIERSRLIGSYERSTQIRPIVSWQTALDVDALLILKSTEHNLNTYWRCNDGGTRLLHDLYLSLKGYSGATVKSDRPSVTVKWKDLKMEVTPAFRAGGGGFLIPSKALGSKAWTLTNPIEDADVLTAANKRWNGEFKPMVKLLKCWNRQNKRILGSFALETVAYHCAVGEFQGYSFELPWFFNKLLEYNGSLLSPPSGRGAPLLINLDAQAKEKIVLHSRAIRDAYAFEQEGQIRNAVTIMNIIFGAPFPKAS